MAGRRSARVTVPVSQYGLYKYRAISSTGEVIESQDLAAIFRYVAAQFGIFGAPSWKIEQEKVL